MNTLILLIALTCILDVVVGADICSDSGTGTGTLIKGSSCASAAGPTLGL
jgi:hypothetical protein